MSVSSVSVAFYGVQAAPPPPRAVAAHSCKPPPAAESRRCGSGESPAPRRSSLADAMMSAFKQMGLVPARAEPAAGQAAEAQATEPDSAPSVREAALQFAQALFQAMRGDEAEPADKAAPPRVDDEHHHKQHRHHGHHHGHGVQRSHNGYAGFAQRLETLAAQYGGSPAAAEKPAPAAEPVVEPAAPAAAVELVEAAPAAQEPASEAAAPVLASTGLAEAFADLLRALRVSLPGGGDAAGGLGSFLQHLSQALQPARDEPPPPTVGMLIHVTA